jgi:hypothetical protein
VAGLAGIAEGGGDGGGQQERVDRVAAGQAVERVGAVPFRGKHGGEPGGVACGDECVVHHHGGVHDTSEGRHFGAHGV